MVQISKKIALLHRYPEDRIKETNAAFPYLKAKGVDVLTFKRFNRLSESAKFFKSLLWVVYAPCLVFGKNYDVIYCDDSFPIYPLLVKMVSPKSKVIIRIGDFHLMYYTSGLLYSLLHFFERLTWRAVDQILVISEPMKEFIGMDKVKVILDPVEIKPLVSHSYGSVMFHGLLVKNKNVDVLLEAAKRMPETMFIIIGDGPDKKRLEKIAPNNVAFKGWIHFDRINHFLGTCAIGVALRSKNRGNDYVVTSPFLQYGVLGKPCVVTKRKVFGSYPYQFSNANELETHLRELLKAPAEAGRQLRDFIVENHSADKIAGEIWSQLSA